SDIPFISLPEIPEAFNDTKQSSSPCQIWEREAEVPVQLRQVYDDLAKRRFLRHSQSGLRPEELGNAARQEKRRRTFSPDKRWRISHEWRSLPFGTKPKRPRGAGRRSWTLRKAEVPVQLPQA